MSIAQRVFHGSFGRVALLDMDHTLVTHSHHECHVLVKAAGADTFFNVNGRRVPLTDRHAVLVNAWQPHFYDHQAGAGPTQILALYIEPAWLAEIQHSLALSAHPGFFTQSGIELNSKNRRLADYLIAEAYSPDLVPRERIESLLFDFLIELIEDHSEWRQLRRLGARSRLGFQDTRIRRACDYLRNHVDDPDCLANAARAANLSRAHFFTLFRRDTGMSPMLMLNDTRMRRAFTWLETQRAGTLGQLAEDLGFSEQGHFTRFFQQHIGAAPSQYRRVIDSYAGQTPPL
ncbi:MAG: AraC family transcriptional regulator [Alcanivorax sp.]|nr:AraC family transcriptional regulator [Alcanivorax sp.]UWN51976.1 Arabinose operon regulatory protein [Alcanivorax sp. ALC70]MAY12063.1 AraC family transcriptional regulator [Alcanivorax sp.]MBI56079.1 AraC family transcriptional regulator [Alcanivorax sp.]MBU57827.1 AraC family transcriptional regulator [Alcanivorax sp.]|tara:strand:- start:3120 stop:3986 length:867 start_codon:yes stop_codon:yes gene_type:complete